MPAPYENDLTASPPPSGNLTPGTREPIRARKVAAYTVLAALCVAPVLLVAWLVPAAGAAGGCGGG